MRSYPERVRHGDHLTQPRREVAALTLGQAWNLQHVVASFALPS